ncbi:quinone oxidoreductase PIG3-like [Schistocerca gregaria]|uniref:quinone oxidoreductase PIG3-like n=1 Tax=Schistocerca gregaria TaxID=7010 RepID=UPI00211F41AD|nr:quinone oxidoreductase PIG3-like [Schistocerca gregaria]
MSALSCHILFKPSTFRIPSVSPRRRFRNMTTMSAVLYKKPGPPEELYVGHTEKPKVPKNNILIRVCAAGINRADILQRKGRYPPPPGESEILGLECSGIIESVGEEVTQWKPGDRVMALLSGGGYAEYVSVPSCLALPIPNNMTMTEAAAIPETFLTVFQSLFWLGQVCENQKILVHGGASGIGTSAIQLAKTVPGVHVTVTAGTDEKCQACVNLGADMAINYKNSQFEEKVKENGGVDFVLDIVGKAYIQQNLNVLNTNGRLVFLSMLSGPIAENLNLAPILQKRLTIMGSTLRSQTLLYRAKLVQEFRDYAMESLEKGRIKPVIDRVFPVDEVKEAHQYIEGNKNTGKLVLALSSE